MICVLLVSRDADFEANAETAQRAGGYVRIKEEQYDDDH